MTKQHEKIKGSLLVEVLMTLFYSNEDKLKNYSQLVHNNNNNLQSNHSWILSLIFDERLYLIERENMRCILSY